MNRIDNLILEELKIMARNEDMDVDAIIEDIGENLYDWVSYLQESLGIEEFLRLSKEISSGMY